MLETEGGAVAVDASNWRYVLYRYPDGQFEIVFVTGGVAEMEDELRGIAGELVVDGELGEDVRIELVDRIDVVSVFGSDVSGRSFPIRYLRAHFSEVSRR